MLELLKDAPKAVLFMVLGAVIGIYLAGYYTALVAQGRGFEAEFSDYGTLKRTSAPEAVEVKKCREMRISYDASLQALTQQTQSFTQRKASSDQAYAEVMKQYHAARVHDDSQKQAYLTDSSSNTVLSSAQNVRVDGYISHVESDLRNKLAVEYNNLSRFCYQASGNQR